MNLSCTGELDIFGEVVVVVQTLKVVRPTSTKGERRSKDPTTRYCNRARGWRLLRAPVRVGPTVRPTVHMEADQLHRAFTYMVTAHAVDTGADERRL